MASKDSEPARSGSLVPAIVVLALAVTLAAIWVAKNSDEPETAPEAASEQFGQIDPPPQYVRNVDESETVAKALGAAAKAVLLTPTKNRDTDHKSPPFSADFRASFPEPPSALSAGDLAVLPLAPSPEALDAAAFMARIHAWFGGLAAVERASWHTYRSLLSSDRSRAFGAGHLQIAGVGADGARRQLVGSVELEAIPSKTVDGAFDVRRLQLIEGTWSVTRAPAFADISEPTGFTVRESAGSRAIAQAVIDARKTPSSGGLTAMDFNDDGATDILVTRKGRGATIFVNDLQGGFTPTTLDAIADPKDAAEFYLWLDLDNDERPELVSTNAERTKDGFALVMYRGAGTGMTADARKLAFKEPEWMRQLDYQSISACDVDGNGFLDLLVVGYTHLESGLRTTNFVQGTDGLRNLLFINHGDLRFTEEAIDRGIQGSLYSFVTECYDFDGDGDSDIFFGNDYAQNNVYLNDGSGRFTEDLEHPFHHGRGFSMGISMADFDNTGRYAVSISNMYSHAGNRIVPLADNLSEDMRETLMGFAAGNSLFEQRDGTWVETAKRRNVDYAQWAWGNMFFDVDNDMDKDLYVVNGKAINTDPDAPDF